MSGPCTWRNGRSGSLIETSVTGYQLTLAGGIRASVSYRSSQMAATRYLARSSASFVPDELTAALAPEGSTAYSLSSIFERVTTSPRRARSLAMKSVNVAGESLLAGTAPVFRILSRTSAFASAFPNSSLRRLHDIGRRACRHDDAPRLCDFVAG